MDKKERLIELCRELRLPSIRKMVQEEGTFRNPTDAFTVLLQVLEQEKNDRFIRSKQNRIRIANFPQKKLLEELVIDALPEQAQQKLPHLKSLDFIKEGFNWIARYWKITYSDRIRDGSLFSGLSRLFCDSPFPHQSVERTSIRKNLTVIRIKI